MNNDIPFLPQRHPELVSGSIVRLALSKRRQTQPDRQILPLRIFSVDEVYFPRAVPIFQLLLARNGGRHVGEGLKIYEAMNGIFRCVAGHQIVSMLRQPLHQIGRYANITRTVKLACKNIDARLSFFSHDKSLAEKWMLKQVQHDGIFEHYSLLTNQGHPELVSGSIGRFAWSHQIQQVLSRNDR